MLICVECGYSVRYLYKEFSKGSIRLARCEHCGGFADNYVETEYFVIFLDIILHRLQAYRHMIFNRLPYIYIKAKLRVFKFAICLVFFDYYVKSLLIKNAAVPAYCENLHNAINRESIDSYNTMNSTPSPASGTTLRHNFFDFSTSAIPPTTQVVIIISSTAEFLLYLFMLTWLTSMYAKRRQQNHNESKNHNENLEKNISSRSSSNSPSYSKVSQATEYPQPIKDQVAELPIILRLLTCGNPELSGLVLAFIVSMYAKLGTVLLMIWNYDVELRIAMFLLTFTSNVIVINVFCRCEEYVAPFLIVLISFASRFFIQMVINIIFGGNFLFYQYIL
eukprot:GHVR01033792.1.p1 GENE.GHVR01033792.1~~GHVR01033792.1.p1  ORF type:complete len:335 (-),score=-8.05 GHVR01033792.1:102-1106(-)